MVCLPVFSLVRWRRFRNKIGKSGHEGGHTVLLFCWRKAVVSQTAEHDVVDWFDVWSWLCWYDWRIDATWDCGASDGEKLWVHSQKVCSECRMYAVRGWCFKVVRVISMFSLSSLLLRALCVLRLSSYSPLCRCSCMFSFLLFYSVFRDLFLSEGVGLVSFCFSFPCDGSFCFDAQHVPCFGLWRRSCGAVVFFVPVGLVCGVDIDLLIPFWPISCS